MLSCCVKKVFKTLFVTLISAVVISCSFVISADSSTDTQVPYDTYTYWYEYSTDKKAVYSKPMYEKVKAISWTDLGLALKLEGITDVISYSGDTYVLDGASSQIIILDSNYALKKVISTVKNISSNEEYSFKNASGIFVDSNSDIYIADTENKRVLICNGNGEFVDTLGLPESRLIPNDFDYKPLKLAKDSNGYLYVISDGSYYGAILYSPEREFLGFYGANTVKSTVLSNISKFIKKIFSNDTKRSASERALPYQFTDLFIDSDDFVYTATGNTNMETEKTEQTGQIKRLSPGGVDILDSDEVNFADVGVDVENQDIIGLEVDKDGYIYALDATYGHIFIYDSECTVLSVFGGGYGEGAQEGSFTSANAITINGDDVVVTDKGQNTISIFRITDYGRMVKSAQTLTIKGKYEQTEELWTGILSQDKNSQIAYMGLAKVYYDKEEYIKAMEYAEIGCDRETYALAFEAVRNDFLRTNFTWIIIGIAIILIVAILIGKKLKQKYGGRIVKSKALINYTQLLAHPVNTFTEIKEKKIGSAALGAVIILLYYITSVMCITNGGFAYTYFDPTSYNSLFTFLQTACLLLLFTLSFWGVASLLGGLGKLKEIFIVVSYSATPLLIGNLLVIVLSNVLIPSELGFLTIIVTALDLYTVFLLCVGLIRINDFEFGRFLGVTVLAIIGMVIILFLIIVIVMLLQLLGGFIATVFNEVVRLFK